MLVLSGAFEEQQRDAGDSDLIKTLFPRLAAVIIDEVVDQGRVVCVRARADLGSRIVHRARAAPVGSRLRVTRYRHLSAGIR